MPFKSQAQLRKFASMVEEGKISREKFNEWLDETADTKNLPERIGKKKSSSSPRKKEKAKSIISKNMRNKRVYMIGRNKTKRKG